MVTSLVLLLLATFWIWETVRYALERYASSIFDATRALHPLLVAAVPLGVLWPDWVSALAVAGGAGLLVAVVDRWIGGSSQPMIVPRGRSRSRGLPSLP